MNKTILSQTVIVITALLSSCGSTKRADLVVYNALVYTVDSSFSTAEAFAVRDGKFIAVGTSDEIRSTYKADETIDAQGLPIYPGFYDAHAHFFGYAQTYGQADLSGATSFDEIIERLRAFRSEHPDARWLLGRGWDQNLWNDKSFPTRDRLDVEFPDVPVYLVRIDGHAALANGKALDLAGITGPVDIEGGLIETQRGEPTGILVDNAMDAVSSLIPSPTTSQLTQFLKKAEDACLAVGLTTVSDAGLGRSSLNLLDSLYNAGQLRIRNHAMIGLSRENLDHYLAAGPYVSDRFTIRTFKILADGALGSRGACLLHPYADAATSGFLLLSPQAIDSAIARIIDSDFQVATHAIGDSANRLVLDIYGKYLNGKNNRRWRIEHAQIIDPADIARFATLKVIASMQPVHQPSDRVMAEARLGPDRLKGAYAWRSLQNAGVRLAFGSDVPVESANPFAGIAAAISRTDAKGEPFGGWRPEEAVSRETALDGFTRTAAYAGFAEDRIGTLMPGMRADFLIVDADPMLASPDEIRRMTPLETWIGGYRYYKRKEGATVGR